MTLEELKKSGCIIFECISGSKAYGLDTPKSDTDIRGVFILPEDLFYSMDYKGQVNNETNDIVYYELRKFIELCANNNPNILEILNVPQKCILNKHPLFYRIDLSLFLSKKCEATFANYAYAQIKKARGLEKKIVNPVEKVRKSVLDFCFIYENGKTIGLKNYLKSKNKLQEHFGLSKVPHMKDCFNLFYNEALKFNGVIRKESSNDIVLSTIPKDEKLEAMLFFNKDGYSTYCKKYREYWDWVANRNDERYSTTIAHGKNYDAKNMMHTFRLLKMAKEIAIEGKVNVERSDREFLLDIKNGKFEYEELVEQAENLKNELVSLYKNSALPDLPNQEKITKLLIELRKAYYNQSKQR